MRALIAGLVALTLAIPVARCAPANAPVAEPQSTSYEDLVTLFEEWRAFHKPLRVDGVPDYSSAAMDVQHRELSAMQGRLAAIEPSGWPVAQQVDHHLVRAEMNGLDFDHRVIRPWTRDPAFYATVFPSQSDVPEREGPGADAAIELWMLQFPLTADRVAELDAQLQTIPKLLEQAKSNLVGDARDLWIAGIGTIAEQSADLTSLAERVSESSPDLLPAIERAREATDAFRAWLESEAPNRMGQSGVGVDHYDWYLRNVHLVPYTWAEQVALMRRELARAHAALRLEEQRNRNLPPLTPIASEAQHTRRLNQAVSEYMAFLREQEIVSIRDYMDGALRARIGRFSPLDESSGFFTQVDYREPVAMRTHGYHWFDLARMASEPHASPIRRAPLLYNIFDGRAEGLATGMEEMMMHAGLFDARPRARELIWVLLAQRAARALGDLMMHANEYTMEEAIRFASAWTPRGWLPENGSTVRGEQHLYLQQPSYGTSYLVGKIQIEQLMAERARQLGDEFSLQRFMDELNAAGVIPVSLLRWELTGQGDEITWLESGGRFPLPR